MLQGTFACGVLYRRLSPRTFFSSCLLYNEKRRIDHLPDLLLVDSKIAKPCHTITLTRYGYASVEKERNACLCSRCFFRFLVETSGVCDARRCQKVSRKKETEHERVSLLSQLSTVGNPTRNITHWKRQYTYRVLRGSQANLFYHSEVLLRGPPRVFVFASHRNIAPQLLHAACPTKIMSNSHNMCPHSCTVCPFHITHPTSQEITRFNPKSMLICSPVDANAMTRAAGLASHTRRCPCATVQQLPDSPYNYFP